MKHKALSPPTPASSPSIMSTLFQRSLPPPPHLLTIPQSFPPSLSFLYRGDVSPVSPHSAPLDPPPLNLQVFVVLYLPAVVHWVFCSWLPCCVLPCSHLTLTHSPEACVCRLHFYPDCNTFWFLLLILPSPGCTFFLLWLWVTVFFFIRN